MVERVIADLCVIGGGSAGLTVAAVASRLGAAVVLIEKHKMGGDCLNYGCVPSKALIAAGKHAAMMRAGAPFGVRPVEPNVDFQRVHDHVHDVIAAIEPNDSQTRFEGLGVRVIRAQGRFISTREVRAGDQVITARRFVVATGSSPTAPPIPGLASVPHFTNETIFDNTERLEHLIVIGAGPIGLEMAQAHRRLGSRVTVVEAFQALGKDDPELSAVVIGALRREGIDLREEAAIARIDGSQERTTVHLAGGEAIAGTHLLVAAGRRVNVGDLDLEKAHVAYDKAGIKVDARLRSVSNKRIFAAGDVVGGPQFTHVAGYHASIIIQNALFRLPTKANTGAVPWVTYTDPELAHVGLTEVQARERHGDAVTVLRWPFHDNDRAQAERRTEGLIKIVTRKNGVILGASIVGLNAGDLLAPWIVAADTGMKVGKLARFIAPYPTLSEVSKRVAGQYFLPSLFSQRTRKIVKILQRVP